MVHFENHYKVPRIIKLGDEMKIVTSSEIARYVYCPRCWWKAKTEGVKVTAKMQEGNKFHQHLSANQPRARFLHISIIVVAILLIFFIMWRFIG
ncbi:hypothetical protein HYU22_04450 [Candidatus Woesearchaeota archaeon]|nr:hypothetical protein [Candidatus Woesearchaeota archaeon]